MSKLVLCVGDLHSPFVQLDKIKELLKWVAFHRYKIKTIVQTGDAYDFFSFSSFDRTQQIFTPSQELREGREFLEQFWRQIKLKAKDAACYQLLGNHDARPHRRLIKRCSELEPFFNQEVLFDFPGVKTIYDHREELVLKPFGYPIMFQHGYYLQPGRHLAKNQMCTVFSHTHRGWTHYTNQYGNENLWELNCGYLANSEADPFLSYAKQRKINTTTVGFGVIDRHGPRFIAL